MSATLDRRVDDLVRGSIVVSRTLELEDLLRRARQNITAAEMLSKRLIRDLDRQELQELEGFDKRAQRLRESLRRLDSSELDVTLNDLADVQEILDDTYRELREEISDELGVDG